jgi:V8-like Glu-specific endopeptidase
MLRRLLFVSVLAVSAQSAYADDFLKISKLLQYQKQAIGQNVQAKLKGESSSSASLSNLIDQEYAVKQSLQALYNRQDKAFYCFPGQTCVDDRIDFFNAVSIEQAAADSTLLLTRTANIFQNPQSSGPTKDPTFSVKTIRNAMCDDKQVDDYNKEHHTDLMHQRFRDEPINAGFCTGFKIGVDLVATAGHCVKSDDDCKSISLISGYHVRSVGDDPSKSISKSQIYACKKIVGSGGAGQSLGKDWTIIETNNPLTDVQTAQLAKPPSVQKADAVTVVGYPMGLPSKIASDAAVLYLANDYFESYVDTFGGNSGSPVFRTDALRQGQVIAEGMLVQGRSDFEITSPCYLSKQYPANSGGEDALYVAAVKDGLPP